VAKFAKENAKNGPKMPILHTYWHSGATCRNSVYVAPPCERILNMIPQAVRNNEDPMRIVTLVVLAVVYSGEIYKVTCAAAVSGILESIS